MCWITKRIKSQQFPNRFIPSNQPSSSKTRSCSTAIFSYLACLQISFFLRVKRGKLDKGDKGAVRKFSDEHQERLKERGDWQVFPRTLLNIAQGNFKVDDSGRVYFNNRPAPEGVRLNRSPAVSWGVERVSRARAKARAALKRRRQRTGLRALK